MNIRFLPPSADGLPSDPRLAAAHAAAVEALDAFPMPEPLDSVGYRSAGNTLVIGSARGALPWADRIAAALPVTVLLLDEDDGAGPPPSATLRVYPVFAAGALVLTGWLGAFQATWQARGQAPRQGRFDLVLDLGAVPQLRTHQPPHGYAAPGAGEGARAAAVDGLLGLVGDFDKPTYFAYKDRLCAHGRNGRTGCNACVDICSAGAIAPDGDLVKVNPYLCAGCGACTTVCPTGALSYAFPTAGHTGARIKAALRAWHDTAGPASSLGAPSVLLHGGQGGALLAGAGPLPAHVLPVALHHAASCGIDVWLSAIAWGAGGVTVLTTADDAPQYAAAIAHQMTVGQAILSGLGYAGAHLHLLHAATSADLAAALRHAAGGAIPAVRAGFHVAADKRNTLDYALEHLVRHAPPSAAATDSAVPHDLQLTENARIEIPLPAASPFGTVAVDKAACSLCMACVGACPAGALQDGRNAPLLRFIEKNCVQCGLCADTCPEDAIALVPRLLLTDARKQPVVLNETQPFHCIRCDKPFGTVRMVESMLGRMAAHPAFAGHLDRLRMCGDCRVVDMMLPQDEVRVEQPGRVEQDGQASMGRATELRRR